MYCQGEMNRGAAPFHVGYKGYHSMLDAIPARVYGQCGEAYFDEAEVDVIQQIICCRRANRGNSSICVNVDVLSDVTSISYFSELNSSL